MAKTISFTSELAKEYTDIFDKSSVRAKKAGEITLVVSKILANWDRYENVAKTLGIPAHLVALIHAMECSLNFGRHLHNGDPLTARTTHVPAGHPKTGNPPFTWEESACDALSMHGLLDWHDWSVAGLCYVLERYNGFGYRNNHPSVKSPYLWSYTTAYTAGKYISDGGFDPNAVSKQPGAIAIFKTLIKSKPFILTPNPHPWPGVFLRFGSVGDGVAMVQARLVHFGFMNPGIESGVFGKTTNESVLAFQRKNTLKDDGIVGQKTWGKLFEGEK